jgi:hypothetical protein
MTPKTTDGDLSGNPKSLKHVLVL